MLSALLIGLITSITFLRCCKAFDITILIGVTLNALLMWVAIRFSSCYLHPVSDIGLALEMYIHQPEITVTSVLLIRLRARG